MITRRPARILAEVAIAVVLLCGLFFVAWYLRADPKITDPAVLRDKLAAAGLDCTGYTALPADSGRAAGCEIATEYIVIDVAPDTGHIYSFDVNSIDRRALHCSDGTRLALVVGDGWVIGPGTESTAQAIQSAVGGRLEAFTC
ncbi:MAG: hypothetical protein EPO22_09515 [Dehalococcoidia bacterium]|nr:MAG: hypothetical protein EPO22_09515 [Dehalococcoidia bacterium]